MDQECIEINENSIQCFLSAIYDVYVLKLANLEGINNRRHIVLENMYNNRIL